MKRYILFSEEELIDLGKGNIIDHRLPNGEILYFMCAERYDEMIEESEQLGYLKEELKGE